MMKTNNPIIVKYNPRDLPFAFRRSPLSTTQVLGAAWKGFFVSENSCDLIFRSKITNKTQHMIYQGSRVLSAVCPSY